MTKEWREDQIEVFRKQAQRHSDGSGDCWCSDCRWLTTLDAVLQRTTAAEGEAAAAGVAEDRAQAHVADLAEALAVVQFEEDKVIGRAKLEAAIGMCEAMLEFVGGFAGRLRSVHQKYLEGEAPHGP